jgi:hypothetical protein
MMTTGRGNHWNIVSACPACELAEMANDFLRPGNVQFPAREHEVHLRIDIPENGQ